MLANESTDLLATSIGLEETCDKAEPVGRILGLRLEVIFFFRGGAKLARRSAERLVARLCYPV